MNFRCAFTAALLTAQLGLAASPYGPIENAPDRSRGEGPWDELIIRGGILIDGTGAPAIGPVDILIRNNRIASITQTGGSGLIVEENPRAASATTHILDISGHYVLPGFIDAHAHIGGSAQGTPAEYVFKLWLAHGITTIRDPGSGNGLQWNLDHRRKSARNEIAAPRIQVFAHFGQDAAAPITTPKQARNWVKFIDGKGADGIKFFGAPPAILEAALGEARKRDLRTALHASQLYVAAANAVDASDWGLTTLEHWYGLPEALFDDRTIQHYPTGYNYANEQHRFGAAGRLWLQAAKPGSDRWNTVLDSLLSNDLTLDPTLAIYEANRDLMRAQRAVWHDEYTLPSLWKFYSADAAAHGSYWIGWTTADEIAWKMNFRRWMQFINDYKNRGGRVIAGSDAGFMYQLYGFNFIRELELLQEAGFSPLEVVRAATLHAAEALGQADNRGSIAAGKYADLVILKENPLANFKALYGTGMLGRDDSGKVIAAGGVRYTVKDGIVYDAKSLLADVRNLVRKAKLKNDHDSKKD